MSAYTRKGRRGLIWIFFFLLLGSLLLLFFYIRHQFTSSKTEVSADVMVERITDMGKLELVKYAMKDVIERKHIRQFLPDERVLFVAVGEVTACIDLTKIRKTDIEQSSADSITVFLPQPEICYARIDHGRSKVYDVSGYWFSNDTKNAVEGIYKLAETRLHANAREMNVLGKARSNAQTIFKPLLENLTAKKVGLSFR
ncbi:MAG: DUF4230 domain-containing protein [Mucilaginibacter polytrichastri]|nr:DUF4230 domain-containing protein [Mucilaginibacter polytrichastri]